ncbi:MAG: type IV pilin-like G/H family protein [Snowella sp.]|nr:type IV pilin-like G/H family protein [Snowella sp.]
MQYPPNHPTLLILRASSRGFTLLELLIVVIIIGILAAIAIPNLINQVGKARESEARTLLGAMNRAQQSYFSEKGLFASNGSQLEVPVTGLKYYQTDDASLFPQPGVTRARSVSNRHELAIHSYIGGVSYDTTNRTFATVICRSLDMTGLGGSSTNVSSYISNYGVVAGNQVTCDSSTTEEVH